MSLLKERSSSNFTFSDWDALYFRPNTVFEQIKEEVQNYLEFSSCIKSLEFLANEFGLTLRQSHVQESELWEKSAESRVKKFEVLNLSNGHLRGILYLDVWHGHQQAAHYNIQTGFAGDPRYNISGMYQVSYLVIPGPSSVSTQIQVSYDFLKTLFHEFGHALQAMCSNTRFQHLGGIRGPLDFVEIPSTFVETFASDYDFLSKFCRHRITGKSLDHELIQNLKSSDRYKRSNMQSQCVLALADQIYSGNDALHLYKKSNSISSVWHDTYYEVFERSMESSLHPQSSRSHLITYGSLYYSYLLAKIVCSQVWNNQFKSLEDGLTGALKFRREILDPGLSRPPSESIQALLGENTDIRDVKFLRKLSHEYIQNELTHHGHNLS